MVCGYVNLVIVVCIAGFGVLFYMFGVATTVVLIGVPVAL